MYLRDTILADPSFQRTATPNPYVSKEEEDFLALCRKNGLNAKLTAAPDGGHSYAIVFEREYLDQVEKGVVEWCKEKGIAYTYYRDLDGNHHYNFPELVCSSFEELEDTHVKLVNYDEILAKHEAKNKPIKKEPKTWWEKTLAKFGLVKVVKQKKKTEYDYFLDSIGCSTEELKKLSSPPER